MLTVSDPRYSATYGNPYLRSPPKHPVIILHPVYVRVMIILFPLQATGPLSYTYSSFSPCDGQTYNPVSYIASPASTATVHSLVSASAR